MSEILYKVLNEDGTPRYGGSGRWHLPQDGQPGEWMPIIEGDLEPCQNGYHLCRPQDLLEWLGPAIFEAEYRGERLDAENKMVVREARLLRKTAWNERTARLFACDCAEQVLGIFEHQYPNDDRPRQAIEIARRFITGQATKQELATAKAAARDAAWAAAWEGAWEVATAAAWAATEDATGDAAKAAAWEAAKAAAWEAAGAAARDTIGDATWTAAEDTAKAAAWAAAWDAARQWQTKQLMQYIEEDPS